MVSRIPVTLLSSKDGVLKLVQQCGLFFFKGVAGFNIDAVFGVAYSLLLSFLVASSAREPGKLARGRNFFYQFDGVSSFTNSETCRGERPAIFWFERAKAIAGDHAGFGQLAVFSSVLFDKLQALRWCRSSQPLEKHCNDGVAQLQWVSR